MEAAIPFQAFTKKTKIGKFDVSGESMAEPCAHCSVVSSSSTSWVDASSSCRVVFWDVKVHF